MMQLSRIQMFSLIVAFERDMRNILDYFVVTTLGLSETLGEFIHEASERRSRDGLDEDSLLEWLDLRHEYELLNRHRDLLPAGLAREVRELTTEIDIIQPIRHTIMHSRPLRPGDPERLRTALSKFTQRHWAQLHDVLTLINSDPLWMPELDLPEPVESGIKHNLPLPDYDETGLLGRDEDIEQLVSTLKRGRDSVITLTGEGGIGKTALALEVAYRLLDDSESPFEVILWVSLKTERLTVHGVEEIVDSVDTLLGATQVLGGGLTDTDFSGGIQELAQALGDARTLICIDNLETISGVEFVQLYEGLSTSVTYLVTSRLGIGQIERRFPIDALNERDAISLLNQLIRYRRVPALKAISGETRKEIAAKCRFSPLAIRWFVLGVESGRDPMALIQDQRELIDYCVRSVQETLSQQAKRVLIALQVLARPATLDDLVFLAQMASRDVQTGLQELVRGSLVKYSLQSNMTTSVEISEAARAYLEAAPIDDEEIRAIIHDNEREFRRFEEQNRQDIQNRDLAPIVIRPRTIEDRATAAMLRKALLASHRRDMETANKLVEEAKSLNPDFWEVWRVDAFITSYVSPSLATSKYKRSYELAETGEQRGVVAYFFGGHLARNEHDLEGALQLLREAHEELQLSATRRALGNSLVWAGDFDEGLPLLRDALSQAKGKEHTITLTALMEGLRRQAEIERTLGNNFHRAWESAFESWNFGLFGLREGRVDSKFQNVASEAAVECALIAKVAVRHHINLSGLNAFLAGVSEAANRLCLHINGANRLLYELEQIASVLPSSPFAQQAIAALRSALGISLDVPASAVKKTFAAKEDGQQFQWRTGTIINLRLDRGYGFIAHPDFPDNLFFHLSALTKGLDSGSLIVGTTVEWVHEVDNLGRHRARLIRRHGDEVGASPPIEHVYPASDEELVRSSNEVEAHVIGKTPLKYMFAVTDEKEARKVLVHQATFLTPREYELAGVGTRLSLVIESQGDDRWRSVTSRLATET